MSETGNERASRDAAVRRDTLLVALVLLIGTIAIGETQTRLPAEWGGGTKALASAVAGGAAMGAAGRLGAIDEGRSRTHAPHPHEQATSL